jgi:protein-S-isoprenylcysteine O-methyltransferase Ste14
MSSTPLFSVRLGRFFFTRRSFIPIPVFILVIVFAEFHPAAVIGGVMLALAGECLRLAAVGYAGYSTRTRTLEAKILVTSGPFSRLRNPLYVGDILLGTGFTLASGGFLPWSAAAYFVLSTAYYYTIIRAEEEFLLTEYREDYVRYTRNVPRFIPRLKPWKGCPASQTFRKEVAWRSEKRTFEAIILLGSASALSALIKNHLIR